MLIIMKMQTWSKVAVRMKLALKCAVALFCLTGLAVCAAAQTIVPASGLPNVIGEYNLSYVRTNLIVSSLLGHSGSNFWNFSQAPTSADSVQRMDIVPITDGGNGSGFPSASFAERFSGGIYSTPAWEYYQISNGVGRLYYGYYNALNALVDPIVVFPQPTVDLPDPIQYGHGWSRQVDYQIYATLGGSEDIAFSENATVDAFGTLVLPGIGPLQALRYTAIDSYDISLDGIDFGTEVDTNYVWLVPGIGFAAEIIQYGADPLGGSQPFTNYFQRVFLSPAVSPPSVVSLTLRPGSAILNWDASTNGSGYVVRSATNLSDTNWLPVAQLTNQSLVVPIAAGVKEQFFTITAQP